MRKIQPYMFTGVLVALVIVFLSAWTGEVVKVPVDEESVKLTWKHQAQFAGFYAAVAVANGRLAMEKVREQPFYLVLLDYKMQDLNGFQTWALQEIDKEVKVVFVTAYYNEESVNAAIDERGLRVCLKPLDIPKLLDYI